MLPEIKLTPNPDAALRFLSEITKGWGDLGEPVMIELRCLMPDRMPDISRFSPDRMGMEMLVEHALAMNATGLNIYPVINPVRASAPIRRDGKLSGALDEDIVAAFFFWADGDDEEAANSIRNFAGPKHTMAVMTGMHPSPRPHIYWRCEDGPIRNLEAWTGIQRSISARLSTDRTVVNPSRIMRLPGTINWPTPKKMARGRVPELTTFRTEYDDDRSPVTFDQMLRVFGTMARHDAPVVPAGSFDIDTGPQAMDRERARIKALSGDQWNIEVFRLVGSYVRKGLSDSEIHALTDLLTLGGYTVDETRDEVQTMIDRTRANPNFQDSEPKYAAPDFDAPPDAEKLDAPRVEWFDDIEPALTDSYIIKGVLGAGSMSVVYGPSNSGKTFFVLDLAFHIAAGAEWRGLRIKQSSVLYLAAEGGRGVSNRIVALKRETGVCDIPFALRRAGMDLLHDAADLKTVYDLTREVQARGGDIPTLIVIDTLSRIMAGGDENSAADMTALIRNIDAIREATGAHIMLVHHTGKDTARGARGHSSLRAATDTEIEVQNEDGNRAATVTKQRDYQGNETFAFSLKSVALGHDQDGDEVTSCVVEPTDSDEFKASRKAAKGRGKNQQIIMETFDQMMAEGLAKGNTGGVGMPDRDQFWAVDINELRRISQGKMTGENAAKLFRTAWDALTAPDGLFVTGNNQTWRIDRRRK